MDYVKTAPSKRGRFSYLRCIMSNQGSKPSQQMDLRGYRCPIPVIRLEAALRKTPKGDQVTVFADDPVATVDIPHFCREAGHRVERLPDSGAACVFLVTCATDPAPEAS